MDDFLARLVFFGIGCTIGYAAATLRANYRISQKILHEIKKTHDEEGSMRLPQFVLRRVLELLVLAFVCYAVLATGRTNADLAETQQQLVDQQAASKIERACTVQFLSATVSALNDRTSNTAPQNAADRAQNLAFGKFVGLIVTPGSSVEVRQAALEGYFAKLSDYLVLMQKTDSAQRAAPYPDADGYMACIEKR